jgi:sortase A
MSELLPTGLLQPDPLPRGAAGVSTSGYLVDAVRLRPAGRRLVSLVSALLFAVGLGVFAFPLFTDVYTTQLVQRPLADEFDTADLAARYAARSIATGEPLTRIIMPAIGVDTVVVEGTSPAALRAGAGHYPTSPLPGEPGNVAIAGHRTTYGKPFSDIDRLAAGDEIQLITPLAVHTYRVVGPPGDAERPCPDGACWVIAPTQWEVVAPTPGAMLTLTTCHPRGSAAQRLIVRAELVGSTPRALDARGQPLPVAPADPPPADGGGA